MNSNYFDELKQLQLLRNKEGYYTLNDSNIDYFFGINDFLTLTPDQYHMALFAASNYFFGIFGINVSSFVAVSAGYLASYLKDEQFYGTFFTNEYYLNNEFKKLCDEKINNNDHIQFYSYVKEVLSKDIPLMEKALMVSTYLKNNNLLDIKSNINTSLQHYDLVNQKNCNDNHFLICKVIFGDDESKARDLNAIKDLKDEELMENIQKLISLKIFKTDDDKDMYVTNLQEGRYKYRQILYDFILPGYLTYRGTDREGNRIEQKSQILNETDRIQKLKNILGYDILDYSDRKNLFINVICILNMCSTDYSADMVYNVMCAINEYCYQGENYDKSVETIIADNIPLTPNNWEQKEIARKVRN